jgi:transcriptional regulator with XRE-family HTH domain
MLIKDQIRSRREALRYTPLDVAKKMGISEQAVRHWESGRSYPSKSKMHDLEKVLSFTIDWTEGQRAGGGAPTAASMIDQNDIDLLLVICKLPPKAKDLMGDLARMHLQAVEAARNVAPVEPPPAPPAPKVQKSRARA